jgi:hypothetical protein
LLDDYTGSKTGDVHAVDVALTLHKKVVAYRENGNIPKAGETSEAL